VKNQGNKDEILGSGAGKEGLDFVQQTINPIIPPVLIRLEGEMIRYWQVMPDKIVACRILLICLFT
jgi:hypothetical protein